MPISAGTLTDVPEFVVAMSSVRRAVQTQAVGGTVHRRQVQSSVNTNTNKAEVRRWRLEWGMADTSIHYNLLKLWNDSFGGAAEITWTPTDESVALRMRFYKKPRFVRVAARTFSITVELEECYGKG